MAAALLSLIPGIASAIPSVISGLSGGAKKRRPPQLEDGEGCGKRRRAYGRGKFGNFGKKLAENPITQGMLFNTGMDLSGRLLSSIFDRGEGLKKRSRRSKNFKLSHGLGVPPPVPFGGMIDRARPVVGYSNRPTMNIASRPLAAPTPRAAITGPSSSNVVSTVRPSHNLTHAPGDVLGPKTVSRPNITSLPNLSGSNTINNILPTKPAAFRPTINTMRPPLSSKPYAIPKIKQGIQTVKRLGTKLGSKAKSFAKATKTKIARLAKTAPGTLKQLAHPKQFSRKLARKAAIKSQNVVSSLRSKATKISNPKLKRGVDKALKVSQRVINKVDRYGQRGNMGSRPYNFSKKLASIGKKAKTLTHSGKTFLKSKITKLKNKGQGMPYLPGPLA